MFSGSKRFFFRGLGALLPTLITLIILIKLVGFVNDNLGRYIGIGLVKGAGWTYKDLGYPSEQSLKTYLETHGIEPGKLTLKRHNQIIQELHKRNLYKLGRSWQMSLLGFFLALILVWIIGFFLASFIGRKLWHAIEGAIIKIPVVKQIYPHVKQITDYVFGQKKLEFARVVAIPYPRKGIWSLGFVTGPAIKRFTEVSENHTVYVTVFVPTSPTPLTGFVVTVPKADVLDMPFTTEQAFRFIVSGGVITPDIDISRLERENSQSSDSQKQ